MSQAPNPFAPPKTDQLVSRADTGGGIWRDGKALVMEKGLGALPRRCVKCNAPATTHMDRTLYWHNPLVYLALMMNVIIYAVIAMIVRKTAKVTISLCEEHRLKRRNGMLGGFLGGLASIGILIVGLAAEAPALAVIGGIGIPVGLIVGLVFLPPVAALKIDDQYVRLRGCGEAFLASFPTWRA